ncbi:MAG: WG repeat-containing protein [Clostridia bacterium]|nr:WG repeat-containing protein [Clostridia bacterium]
MTLVDERELQNEKEKNAKLFKLIIKIIIVLVIVVAVLLICRTIAKKRTFKCFVDDKQNTSVKDSIMYKDSKGKVYIENGKVFISIRELSNTLGYQFYNSEYKKKGEDKSKCQVQVDNIYTSYIAGSNKIYRAIITNPTDEEESNSNNSNNQDGFQEIEEAKNVEFEYFTVEDSIKYENDELYASIEAIQIGFDITIKYDGSNNSLTIQTLDYLEGKAKNARTDYAPSSEYSYKNKRLLKYGMTVVKDTQGNYGVASYTNTEKAGTYVASCKYSQLDFNEGTSTLATITNNDNKAGLLYLNIENQEVVKNITSEYQELREMTDGFNYFLVKQSGKYGIINENGNVIIPVIFDEIGIEEEDYSDITCKYILDGKYVPVKLNGKWGLYSIEGIKIIEPQYEEVGCNLAQNGDSVVIIPNIKDGITGIVFLYNREKAFYGLYNADTGERIAISLTEVFKKVENGEENYYINYIIDRITSKVHTINVRTEL